MSVFVVSIALAVLLGAGAMLSPAWRTAQPRVALAATLCLALVMGGAVFYAEAFGWDTLVVDYLLFALLSGVVLGGTLSTAQARAEARGERLPDRDQGWPGPEDLAFFALVALAVCVPLARMPAPLGAQGQINGAHSLAARESESFNSLWILAADEEVIVSPGLHALSAYLSQQLDQPIPIIQLSLGASAVFLLVWLVYDFGAETRDKRLGRAMALALMLNPGLWRGYLDGHLGELLGLLFTLAFLLYALRLLRAFNLADAAAGGLLLGAVVYVNLSMSLVALMAFAALMAVAWTAPGASNKSRVGLSLGLPMMALLGISPWLARNWSLIYPITPSPHAAGLERIGEVSGGGGLPVVVLALCGAFVCVRAKGTIRALALVMLGWLLLVLEAALIGALGTWLPPLGALTNAPNLARHGVILPLSFFGGVALLEVWDAWLPAGWKRRLRRAAYPLMLLIGAIILFAGAQFPALLDAARAPLGLPPARVSWDDMVAMSWLRDNTREDALLLAADGDGWLPVFAERRALDFRAVGYFEWDAVAGAVLDPAEASYVFVPAGADPPEFAALERVYQSKGAQVFARHRNET